MFKFYENAYAFELFTKLVTAKHISLRTIDWFITTWSNEQRIVLYWNGQSWVDKMVNKVDIVYLNIYGEYINNLNTFSKKYFDIFRRKNNSSIINFKNIHTNLAQLIFCKWLIESKLADYILMNVEYINKIYKQYHTSGDNMPIITIKGDKQTKRMHEISVCID